MAALKSQYIIILKKALEDRFVPFLPPLLGNIPVDLKAKQLSRAFSAFALHKLLDITPQVAAAAVVDDFADKGIDAIYYRAPSETLYLLQSMANASWPSCPPASQNFLARGLMSVICATCASFTKLFQFGTQCVLDWAGGITARCCAWRIPLPASSA